MDEFKKVYNKFKTVPIFKYILIGIICVLIGYILFFGPLTLAAILGKGWPIFLYIINVGIMVGIGLYIELEVD